jgi:uroporphyrinogen-III decarboxylase
MGYAHIAPGPHPRLTIHPPLSAACAIMEPALVYEMLAAEPELADVLLDKCHETLVRLIDFWDHRCGRKTTSLGLADDNTCFISNEMYRRFVLPRNLDLYERYGTEHRSLHADGPSDQHFKTYADEIRLDRMDIGGWSSIDAAVRDMKGKVLIHGAMNNRDLYNGLTDEAKRKMRHQMRVAAPGGGYEFAIGGETYVGIEPETLIEFVAYAKRIGRYPIDIDEEKGR